MLESLFNEVADLKSCNFFKKKLKRRCFPEKFPEFLRKPVLKNRFMYIGIIGFTVENTGGIDFFKSKL